MSELMLYENSISYISEFAFAGATRIFSLSIGNNPQMTVSYDAFYGFYISDSMCEAIRQ